MQRFILKTNITTADQISLLRTVLEQERQVVKWSIDMEDVDKVLVVNADFQQEAELIKLVNTRGIHCSALAD